MIDEELRKYLEPIVAEQSFAERLSKFRVLHHKATFYEDWLAIRSAQSLIEHLTEENEKLKNRIMRLEE
jgi:hypothetical protein